MTLLNFSKVILLFFIFWIGLQTDLVLASSTDKQERQTVRLGIRLIDVSQIDSKTETFTVEGILYVDWFDASQKDQTGEWGEATTDLRLEKMDWWPAPEFENARGVRERSGMLLGIYDDGEIEYEERFSLTLSTDLNLRQFPFDSQTLPIKLIIGGGPEDQIKLEISEFSPGLIKMPEWEFSRDSFEQKIETGIKPYGAEFSPLFSRALFSINIERHWGFYFWRIILPLLIIITASWAVFWMRPNELGDRLSISFTALLTIVAFNFIVADTLPKISYLSLLDVLITITYLWIGFSIILSVVIYKLNENKQSTKVKKVNQFARIVAPSSYYLTSVVLILLFIMF